MVRRPADPLLAALSRRRPASLMMCDQLSVCTLAIQERADYPAGHLRGKDVSGPHENGGVEAPSLNVASRHSPQLHPLGLPATHGSAAMLSSSSAQQDGHRSADVPRWIRFDHECRTG